MPFDFGGIDSMDINAVLKNKKFNSVWAINKDKIDVCKDCEFRYICVDCRAFLKDPSNELSKPLKCNYDPYHGQWMQ